MIGTDNGIYLVNQRPNGDNIEPWRILVVFGVTQIDILEEYRLFIVLSNGALCLYPVQVLLDAIEHEELVFCDPWKVQDNVDFFKIGISLGQRLVCSVNTSASSSNIKLFEPADVLSMRLSQDSLYWRGGKILKLFKVSNTAFSDKGVVLSHSKRHSTFQPNAGLYTSFDQL